MKSKLLLSASLAAAFLAPTLALAQTTIPAGTQVDCSLQQTLDTGKLHDGDTFTCTEKDTLFHKTPLLHGAVFNGHVENVSAAHPGHNPSVTVIFDSVTINGQTQPIQAQILNSKDFVPHMHLLRDAFVVAGSALAGHEVAKHTGKKHGTVAGAAAGVALVAAMKSNIVVKRSTPVKLRLQQPVSV